MKNTDFMNLSLPEGADKIDVEILNNDFKKLESEASKHYIKQQIEVDGTATIIGSIGPYVQLENLTDNILNVRIGDELVILTKGDNRKIRTISGENYSVVTSGAVRITYYINAQTYADENFYKKEKVDELLQNVEATVEVDAELSETSENPVQNKVITAELASYATTAEVESKITEKVAEIVAGAPEDFDTLKEMSDWLTEHEDSAATMNSAIQKNAEDIATANTAIEKNKTDISTANTNIQKNINDITAVKNSVAINKSTLGIQCKNLLNPDKHTISNCTEEKDGNTYTVTNTGAWSQWYWFLKGKTGQKYNLTFEISELTGDSTLNDVYIKDISADTSIQLFNVRKDGALSIGFTAISDGTIRIGWCPNNSGTNRELSFKVSNFMCRSADITDSTYAPYTPSLQEQINSLLARIETLEGTTNTTTEGGE